MLYEQVRNTWLGHIRSSLGQFLPTRFLADRLGQRSLVGSGYPACATVRSGVPARATRRSRISWRMSTSWIPDRTSRVRRRSLVGPPTVRSILLALLESLESLVGPLSRVLLRYETVHVTSRLGLAVVSGTRSPLPATGTGVIGKRGIGAENEDVLRRRLLTSPGGVRLYSVEPRSGRTGAIICTTNTYANYSNGASVFSREFRALSFAVNRESESVI